MAVIAAVVIILVGFFVWGQRGGRTFDSANCPEDEEYAVQVAVVLDPSDTLSAVQEISARDRLMGIIEDTVTVPTTGELRLFTVRQAGRGDTTAVFRVCKPTHPDRVGTVTGNRRIATERFEREFVNPLRDTLSMLLNHSAQLVSPIAEAVQVAVVNAFRPRDATMPRHLVIVSDMLQNSGIESFYDDGPIDFRDLARNPDYGTLRVDLSGVTVTVLQLARGGEAGRMQRQGLDAGRVTAVQRFWEDYFVDQGVGLTRIRWVMVEG